MRNFPAFSQISREHANKDIQICPFLEKHMETAMTKFGLFLDHMETAKSTHLIQIQQCKNVCKATVAHCYHCAIRVASSYLLAEANCF